MNQKPSAPDRRADVLRLSFVEGKSIREISRTLGMSRKTIRRTLLSEPSRPVVLAPSTVRIRILDPYEDTLRQLLRDDEAIKAPAVLERLREAGFPGGITVVRDRLREIRPRVLHEPFLTLEHPPGDQLQIDWFDAGFALSGVPRRVSGFVAVLAYSRMLYLEFVLSQRFGSFLRCMERALNFFGGTATADVFDNMNPSCSIAKAACRASIPGSSSTRVYAPSLSPSACRASLTKRAASSAVLASFARDSCPADASPACST